MGGSQDLSLRVLLQAVDSGFSSIVKGLGSVLGGLGPIAGVAAGALLAISTAAVSIGVASVQMAGQYDQAMRMVQSLTGASSAQMAQYDSQLKQLAINAGVAPTDLAKGLYNVLSASFKGADAMNVLTLATEDAKIGMTNATVTTDALTNILRSFGTQSKDITTVNGEMLETVTLGKATFEQYAQSIVKSASSANQFHVSMETMNAAWATMTSSGIRAAQASTDFQQSLKVMDGNIGTVAASLHKNGIAFNEAKFNSMSYGDQVVYLNAALEKANEKHVKVTGVTLQAAQAISTIAKHIGDYNNNLKTLSDKQAMAQKTQQAWAITQGGFNQTMSRISAAVQVLFINIGQQLLPVLTQIGQAVLPVILAFASWVTQSGIITTILGDVGSGIKDVIGFVSALVGWGTAVYNFFHNNQVAALALMVPLGALGMALSIMATNAIVAFIATIPGMVAGFGAWAVGAWAAAAGTIAATWPLLLIGAAIGLVIGIILLLWKHWSQVSQWMGNAMKVVSAVFHAQIALIGSAFSWLGTQVHDILTSIGGFFSNLGTTVHNVVTGIIAWWQALPGNILSYIDNLVTGGIKKFEDFWNNVVKGAQSILGKLGNAISGIFKGAINLAIIDPVNWIIDQLDKIHVSTPFGSVGFTIPHIPLLASGGDIISGGSVIVGDRGPELLNVPAGARVTPLQGSGRRSFTGGGDTYIVNVYASNANASQVADMVMDRLNRKYRRSGVVANPALGARSS